MKASPREINNYLKSLNSNIRAVLIFGKDDGLIRERRDLIAKQIVGNTDDPFSLCSLSFEQIVDDPARIADEMGAVSMMGGRRLVKIDNGGDKLTDAINNALQQKTGDALLLVTSGDLSPRSTLRKFFESEKDVLAIACYADTEESLDTLITSFFRHHHISAERDVISYLTQHLGNDRLVTRMELEKITFYLDTDESQDGSSRTLSLEDAKLIVAEASSLTLGDISTATTSSDPEKLATLLDRAVSEGISAIEILRTLQFRLQQLHLVRGLMDEGMPLKDALSKLRPPLFFRDRDIFVSQARRWPHKKITSALNYAIRAEVGCKNTGAPDFAIASKACMDICLSIGKSI